LSHKRSNYTLKMVKIASCLATLLSVANAWKQKGIYFEKNFNWAAMEDDIIAAMDSGYNRVYIGFYMSRYGCQGACLQWEQLSDINKQKVFAKASSTDSKIMLSVGGEGEFVEKIYEDGDTKAFGDVAAEYALNNGYHGIDYNIHLAGRSSIYSEFAASGELVDFMSIMVESAKEVGWLREQLTVTAQAPYFSLYFVNGIESRTLSWIGLDKNEDKSFSIGDMHMVMFNEDQDYTSYEEMFIKNEYYNETDGTIGYGSAVQQILDLGVSGDKIAVVKPIYEDGFSIYSGYVAPGTLNDWMCQAREEVSDAGGQFWDGGYVMWTWNSNNEDTYVWPSFLEDCDMASRDADVNPKFRSIN